MNTYTQNQTQAVLKKPHARSVMASYIESAVRREFLLLFLAPDSDLVNNEEELLQQRWYELRKWAFPLGVAGFDLRRKVVHMLQGMAIEASRRYPEMSRADKTKVIHRVLTRGFPGLFSNPDPIPEG